MTIWITTDGRPSNGAAELGKHPGFRRAKQGGAILPTDTVINWGSSTLAFKHPNMLNPPYAVATAVNKLKAFGAFSAAGVPVVEWTNNQQVAQQWSYDGFVVVVRGKLTGHEGDGIIIVEKGQQVPPAHLYTKYVFKDSEYRVHVIHGQVIDTARKIRDPHREPTDWKVRSWKNGFIFARKNVQPNAQRDAASIAAIKSLGLDFGAVDLIVDKEGHYYVLEVNTAPGIEGQTVTNYAKAFQNG